MKSKRSLRLFSNTLTAAGLALAVSACSTLYPAQGKHDWDQSSDVPDLNEPAQRSQALLDYCKRLHNRGDLNLAAGICNRAHEINPTDPAPLVQLARVMNDLEQPASAEEAYRAALLLDPEQTDALYGLGKIYIDQQRYDRALEPLELAAQQDTADPRIYNALGVIKDQQGQHTEAQVYYRQGLDHSPRNVSLRNNLGLSMVLDGQPDAGLAMLRDVAAEPAAGATAGRNLEMASQIAAKGVAEATADQTAMGGPAIEDDAVASQELESLAPSADADAAEAPASEPLTLLETPAPAHAGASDTAPPSLQELPPPNASSLDMELAAAMTADAMTPDTSAAADPQDAETTESGAQAAAQPAADPAADPVADPAVELSAASDANEASDAQGDWSGAAQTAFDASSAANDNTASTTANTTAGGAPAAAETSMTSTEAPAEPAETASADSSNAPGGLQIAPASTPATAPQTAAISGGYGIDEDTFYTAQLGSYRTEAHAREGWQVLKDSAGELLADSDAFIVRADLGGDKGIYYRVRAGTLADHAAAKQFCQDLQAQGVDCMPVEASWQTTNETLVDKICESGSSGALCGSAEDSDAARGGPPHAKG